MKSLAKALFTAFLLGFFSLPVLPATDREPVVAGQFYPSAPEQIIRQVEKYLSEASSDVKIDSNRDLIGIVVPHAGWVFSGKTAAAAFKAVDKISFSNAIFIGVDHRTQQSTIGLWPDGNFVTPIGKTKIDLELNDLLLKKSLKIVKEPLQHESEHSLEVLLPFFQKLFPSNDAVFISCGGPPENGEVLAESLREVVKNLPGKTLLIISSDWSHYHSAEIAEKLDETGINSVLSFDSSRLLDDCREGRTELCGLNGVISAIELFKNASATVELLERTDSSAGNGDREKVVGYAAILFQGQKKAIQNDKDSITKHEESQRMGFEQEALKAVRHTLEAHLQGKSVPELRFTDPKFEEKRGIFVTLKKNGELRGCIGFIRGFEPLKTAIPEMAISAATQDPRFNPVKFEELKEIKIEISVLTPMEDVKDISDIKIGRDGLFLQLGGRSGLLLPQVPVEWEWDVEEFLDNLCLKAGLGIGSHKDPRAKLQKFSAEVFGED